MLNSFVMENILVIGAGAATFIGLNIVSKLRIRNIFSIICVLAVICLISFKLFSAVDASYNDNTKSNMKKPLSIETVINKVSNASYDKNSFNEVKELVGRDYNKDFSNLLKTSYSNKSTDYTFAN